MTSAEALNNEWCIIEWEDFTRTIVNASEVCELHDTQTSGNTIFIKRGDEQIRSSLVARSTNRKKLVRELNRYRGKRINVKPVSDAADDDNIDEDDDDDEGGDQKEPSEFEPSATDWAPSDENPSDSEFEVENKRRKLNTSKTVFNKRASKFKNVLTPSNKVNSNSTVSRRNTRKQTAPKHYISPPKDEPIFYVPLPKKQISPINGKVVHILPNSTRPPNSVKKGPNKKPVAAYSKKRISPIATNHSERKRAYESSKTITRKSNIAFTSTPKPNCILKESSIKMYLTPKDKENNMSTPKQTVIRKMKVENQIRKNDSNILAEENVSNKPNKETETELINTKEDENSVNKDDIRKNGQKLHNDTENENSNRNPDISNVMNVMMDVKMYLEFRHSIRKMYKMYDTALKVIPRIKRKELGLKKLTKFYKPQLVEATEQEFKTVNKKSSPPKEIVNDINEMDAENNSDEDVENEHVDDFDRSDDNILISNKFANIHAPPVAAKEPNNNDSKMVAIGSGKTLIPKDKFRKIKWHSYTVATRGLLLAAFPRRVLATHSMTGKKSPAFLNKPAKMCLDPKKVADIIIEVMDRFKIRENLVRSVITTKCADESKMFKMRMQKKERDSGAVEKKNNKRKPTLAA